jgi:Transposase domain (DUF772)
MIRTVVDAALCELSGRSENSTHVWAGQGSGPRSCCGLQTFLVDPLGTPAMERLKFDLLFRCFVGLGIEDPVWDASTFSKNRDHLPADVVARRFLATVLARREVKGLQRGRHG